MPAQQPWECSNDWNLVGHTQGHSFINAWVDPLLDSAVMLLLTLGFARRACGKGYGASQSCVLVWCQTMAVVLGAMLSALWAITAAGQGKGTHCTAFAIVASTCAGIYALAALLASMASNAFHWSVFPSGILAVFVTFLGMQRLSVTMNLSMGADLPDTLLLATLRVVCFASCAIANLLPAAEFFCRRSPRPADAAQAARHVASWASRTHAHKQASWPSYLTVSWLWRLLEHGSNCQLAVEDVPQLAPEDDDQEQAEAVWQALLGPPAHPCLGRTASALWSTFRTPMLILGALQACVVALSFAGPLLLQRLLQWIENVEEGRNWDALALAVGMPAAALLSAVVGTAFNYGVAQVQVRVRRALLPAIFKASVACPAHLRPAFNTGRVTDMFSVDTQQVMDVVASAHQLWALPVQVAVTLYLLYTQVHSAFLAGAAIIALFVPLNIALSKRIGALTSEMMGHRDERLQAGGEALSSISSLKMLGWEVFSLARMVFAREREVAALSARKFLDAACVYLWAATPVLVTLCTFAAVYGLSHTAGRHAALKPSAVFTAVSLLQSLVFPLNAYAWVVTGVLQAGVSARRMDAFFESLTVPAPDLPLQNAQAVLSVQGSFAWRHADIAADTNRAMSAHKGGQVVKFPKETSLVRGDRVLVHGQVASGKSSVLMALAGIMPPLTSGRRRQSAVHTILVPPKPWIRRMTVHENLVCLGDALVPLPGHEALRTALAQRALSAVDLEVDLASFPRGTSTRIRPGRLSGGQASRLGLARGLYAAWLVATTCDAEEPGALLLLDAPLGALDATTAANVTRRALNAGALQGTPWYDKVRSHISIVLATHRPESFHGWSTSHWHIASGLVTTSHTSHHADQGGSVAPAFSRKSAEAALSDEVGAEGVVEDPSQDEDDTEHRQAGALAGGTLSVYACAVPVGLLVVLFVSMLVMQSTRNGADWWLAQWSSSVALAERQAAQSSPGNTSSPSFFMPRRELWSPPPGFASSEFLVVFAAIAGVNTLATLIRSLAFAEGGLQAAKVLHRRLVSAIFSAPLTWFARHPTGQVTNRLSRDQYAVDETLPFQVNILLAQLLGITGTLVILGIATQGVFLAALPIVGVAYWRLQHVYRTAISRELKRLDSVTRSPLFAHFDECVALESPGLAVLQAAEVGATTQGGGVLRAELSRLQSVLRVNQRVLFANMAGAQWLGIRLQGLGVFVLCVISLWAVFDRLLADPPEPGQHPGDAPGAYSTAEQSAGASGLALAYALPITAALQGLIAALAATEQEFVSVERVREYFGAPRESQNLTSALSTALRHLHDQVGGTVQGCWCCLRAASATAASRQQVNAEFTAATGGRRAPPPQLSINIDGSAATRPLLLGASLGPEPDRTLHLRLKHLGVSYASESSQRRPLALDLRQHDISIAPGTKVGVVGRTGSGKSTLLAALWRLTPSPAHGAVLWNGREASRVPLLAHRTSMTAVPQDPLVLSGQVRDSLDPYGRHSLQEMQEALRSVGLARLTPWDEVEPGAANLSSGTKQLLSIARALLEGRSFVAVDEATSSTDAGAEEVVTSLLRALPATTTLFVIAHRLATLQGMDLIMVLQEGKLVEFGSPRELASRGGAYSQLLAASHSGAASGATRP